MQATPATWRLLLEARWQGRKQLKLLCGGEAFLRRTGCQLLEQGASPWNLYGPTETTILVNAEASGDCRPQYRRAGQADRQHAMYVLNRSLQPVPVGVAEELFIGGWLGAATSSARS